MHTRKRKVFKREMYKYLSKTFRETCSKTVRHILHEKHKDILKSLYQEVITPFNFAHCINYFCKCNVNVPQLRKN